MLSTTVISRFKDLFFGRYSLHQVGALMRILQGINFLHLMLFIIFPSYSYFYMSGGMIDPTTFDYYIYSPLFYIWDYEFLKMLFFLVTFLLTLMFTLGFYARYVHIPLFFCHVFIHHANPLIVHEPNQLTNLLMLLFLFIPIEQAYVMRKGKFLRFFENISQRQLFIIFKLLTIYIGSYYFFAGLKKLPDQNWLDGLGVKSVLEWPLVGKDNLVVDFILQHPWAYYFSNYFSLLFEFLFLPLSLIPYVSPVLIFLGFFFHTFLNICMDIGGFHTAMWMWYPLLLRLKR